jgi:hypothetical protein
MKNVMKAIKNRRGNAIIGALTLIPMLGFASLSVDIGMQKTIQAQLQASADFAAISGAGYLDGTQDGVYDAVISALNTAGQNEVYFDYSLSTENILVGRYEDGVFTELTYSDYEEINSIKVINFHEYKTILSHVAFGVDSLNSAAESIAVRRPGGGAKYVNCYLPFAIPVCHFENLLENTNPDPIKLSLMSINTVGWGLPSSKPNTNTIIDQLGDTCSNETISTYSEEEGDTELNNIYLSNGQNNAAVAYATDVINEAYSPNIEPTEWPYDYFGSRPQRNNRNANLAFNSDISAINWGNNIDGVVPIIEHGCGDGFTGSSRILGWTYAYIYDGATKGGDKNIWIQFDFINEYDVGYGYDPDAVGNVLGTAPPQLVY